MKLNLEKNFKSLFKTKVSFTMAALTIFAITGGVSFADDVPPLKEDLDPMNTTIKPIEEINKTNKQVNKIGLVLTEIEELLPMWEELSTMR